MTFQVKQRKHNKTYIYEAKSYWDSNKKQSRQKRKYIGVWDEKKNKIIPKQKSMSPLNISIYKSKSYGDCYFFKELIEQLKLNKVLESNFVEWKNILSICFAKLKHPCSLRLSKVILEDSCFENIYGVEPLSSQQISRLLIKLHQIPPQFFEDWMKKNEHSAVFYDITSLSSYSKQNPLLEWGYNRDKTSLPQVNLGLVVSEKDKTPLYYKIFPGSITDVMTIINLNKELCLFELKNFEYILDNGFFSLKNIKDMIKNKLKFIIPLSRSTKKFGELIAVLHNY